jgi:hypothetical protein
LLNFQRTCANAAWAAQPYRLVPSRVPAAKAHYIAFCSLLSSKIGSGLINLETGGRTKPFTATSHRKRRQMRDRQSELLDGAAIVAALRQRVRRAAGRCRCAGRGTDEKPDRGGAEAFSENDGSRRRGITNPERGPQVPSPALEQSDQTLDRKGTPSRHGTSRDTPPPSRNPHF